MLLGHHDLVGAARGQSHLRLELLNLLLAEPLDQVGLLDTAADEERLRDLRRDYLYLRRRVVQTLHHDGFLMTCGLVSFFIGLELFGVTQVVGGALNLRSCD